MSALLQLETLTDNFGNDPETFVQILDIFLTEVPEDFELLKSQIATQDFKNAGETAHKVKSSYRLLDMANETMILQEIENRAKEEKNTQDIPELFAQFEMNYSDGIAIVIASRDHFKTLS